MEAPASTLSYPSLDDPTCETRLIRFDKAAEPLSTDSAPIQCHLEVVNLKASTKPEYHALSYCWGGMSETTPIYVNGYIHYITTNLEAALRRARKNDRGRLIWADALCINQQDLIEKASQVDLMATIFTEASCCLFWLGNTAEEPGDGRYSILEEDAEKSFNLICSLAHDEHYTSRDSEEQVTLGSLMKLQWWHRIWTVQEAILPQKCVAMCGPLQLPWVWFTEASANFRRHHYKRCCYRGVSSLKEFNNKIQELEDIRRELNSDGGTNMNRMFQRFQDRHATDPRDKVFGLLALGATKSSGLTMTAGLGADYSVTNQEVFTQVASKLIRQTRVLDLLQRVREYDRNPHLPSWVPDWASKNDRHRNRELSTWACWDLHNASAGRKAEFGDSIIPSTDILVLAGIKVDDINVVGASCEDLQAFMPQPEGSMVINFPDRQWRRLMGKRASADEKYPLGPGTYEEAFMRVLALNFLEDYDLAENRVIRRRIAPAEVAPCLRETQSSHQQQTYFQSKMINHRFFITNTGLIGRGPVDVAPGDEVFILLGGNMPFILRRSNLSTYAPEIGSFHTLVGDAYVHGIMDGEYVDEPKKLWIHLV